MEEPNRSASRALSMGSLTPELSLSVGLIFSQRQLSKVQARRWPLRFLKSLPTQRDDPKHNLKLHVFPVLQETLLGVLLHEGRTGFPFRLQPRELWFVFPCGCSSPRPDADFWQPP